MEPRREGTARVWDVCCLFRVMPIFFLAIQLAGYFFDWPGAPLGDGAVTGPDSLNICMRVGMILWALFLRGRLAEYLKMARLGAFVGIVAFFAVAAWWNNNTSRLDCSVLGQPMGPVVMQEACLGRSMEHTVPGIGTHHNLVVTGEELSGPPIKWFWQQLFLPSTSEGIQKRWQDTYRLDCSVLGKPLVGPVTPSRKSWRRYLRAMKQNNRTCAIMACTMAVEGMHYKVYETFHGPNTFPDDWKAAKDWNGQLLRTCKDEKIWAEGEGSVVGDVLTMIQKMLGGVRTASGQGQQLVMRLARYKKHSGDELTPESVAYLIDQGPCVGRLWAAPWYSCFDATKNDNWVYRGCGRDKATREDCKSKYPDEKDIMGSHAVVCFEYRRVCENGEMHVRVLDNHSDSGPERWIDVEELDALYSLKVDCLCGSPQHYHDAAGASGTVT